MLNNEFITKKVCDHPYPPKVGVNQQQKMGGGGVSQETVNLPNFYFG